MNPPNPVDANNITGSSIDASAEQLAADQAGKALFDNPENARKTTNLITRFVDSYRQHKNSLPLAEWLDQEFAQYPDIWTDAAERQQTALAIIETIQHNNQAKAELYEHLAAGRSRESWLAKKIEQGAASSGLANVGDYAQGIDTALEQANQLNWDAVTRLDKQVSQSPNLDGFIAEHHHANTFNLDAVAKGSPYRAKVLQPEPGATYGKNSMDIGIYDGDGKLVRRYQAKYGADADATTKLFEKGDYRGQRKLVPEGHGDAKSTEVIEIEGVSSKPLSKETAKAMQGKAQQETEVKQYEWSDTNRTVIAKEIGKKALITAAFSAGFQGARIFGRRLWNSINGKENRPANEDLQEFFTAALNSGTNAGVQVAVSGALVVAVKNGWIGVLKNTPAGRIADLVYVGLENAKCLYKLAKGEITSVEALDAMGNVSCTVLGGIAGAAKGGAVGASLGTALGPIGIAVGGFVGGVVGGIAGSGIGDAIYQGAAKLAKTAANVVASAYETAKNVASNVFNTLTFGLFR